MSAILHLWASFSHIPLCTMQTTLIPCIEWDAAFRKILQSFCTGIQMHKNGISTSRAYEMYNSKSSSTGSSVIQGRTCCPLRWHGFLSSSAPEKDDTPSFAPWRLYNHSQSTSSTDKQAILDRFSGSEFHDAARRSTLDVPTLKEHLEVRSSEYTPC